MSELGDNPAVEAPKKLSRSFRLRRKVTLLASEVERLKAELRETEGLLSEALINLDLFRRRAAPTGRMV